MAQPRSEKFAAKCPAWHSSSVCEIAGSSDGKKEMGWKLCQREKRKEGKERNRERERE